MAPEVAPSSFAWGGVSPRATGGTPGKQVDVISHIKWVHFTVTGRRAEGQKSVFARPPPEWPGFIYFLCLKKADASELK